MMLSFYVFLTCAALFCAAGYVYVWYWRNKNTWYRENDEDENLSLPERLYRRKERRKLGYFLQATAIGIILSMMPYLVSLHRNGMTTDWVLLIMVCAVLYVAIKR